MKYSDIENYGYVSIIITTQKTMKTKIAEISHMLSSIKFHLAYAN